MEENDIAVGLAAMIQEVRQVAEADVSVACADNAENALESLLKSAAIHGFNIVSEDR
jgi:hypothetical protein